MSVVFDTLKLAKRLEGAGFTRDQANGAAEALADTFSAEIATKADLAKLGSELRTEMAAMKNELRDEIAGVKGEIVGVKGEIAGVKGEIVGVKGDVASAKTFTAQWIIGAVLANFVGMAALVFAALRFARP